MPKPPTSQHRTPAETNADRLRAANANGELDDPDATEVLEKVDTTRPLGARDGEHGHIDGPRGVQLFHKHDDPPGTTAHGHKRGTYGLAATVGLNDWVAPLAATTPPGADQTADPPPAGTGGAAGDASAPPAGAGNGDPASASTAGSGRPTSLERATVVGRSRLIEVEAKVRARLREVQQLKDLQDLIDAATDQLDLGHLVGPVVIQQLRDTVGHWAKDRGVAS